MFVIDFVEHVRDHQDNTIQHARAAASQLDREANRAAPQLSKVSYSHIESCIASRCRTKVWVRRIEKVGFASV